MVRSDATFVPWLDSLRGHLVKVYPFVDGVGPIPDNAFLEPRWTLSLENEQPRIPDIDTNGHTSRVNNNVNALLHDHRYKIKSQHAHHIFLDANSVPSSPTSNTYPYDTNLQVSLVQNYRLTPITHFQDVRHLIFTSPETFTYLPGDILMIRPRNPERDVQLMLNMMEWTSIADEPLLFHHTNKTSQSPFDPPPIPSSSIPQRMTLRRLLTNNLDINAIPRRSFFSSIASCTSDETQKHRLLEFASPELSEDLHDYATRPRRSILETLHDFHTVRIPFRYATTVLPILRGRQFSIASGGELLHQLPQTADQEQLLGLSSNPYLAPAAPSQPGHGTRIDVLMALVSYRTVLKRLRQGTCSRYISPLPIGSELLVTLQRGSFGLKPSDIKQPVLLVGPGTGLAPMRALIWQRKAWAEDYMKRREAQRTADGVADAASASECVGETVLMFGARSKEADYFFESEWAELARHKHFPFRVLTAFSRDAAEQQADLQQAPPNGVHSTSSVSNGRSPSIEHEQPTNISDNTALTSSSQVTIIKTKPYVQSLIRVHAELVYGILHDKGGKIFISGSAGAMPRGVREAVVDVFERVGAQSRESAEMEVRAMEQAGRWVVECW